MHQTGAFVVLVFGAGHVDQGNPMMFIVVGDKRQVFVGVDDVAAQEVAVEPLHVVEAASAEDNMGEFRGRDDLALCCSVGSHRCHL